MLSAYRQMRDQSTDVLCDIGEDNFDKAFERIRPLIQGNADVGPRLFEEEVKLALDYCADMYSTTPEMKDEVKGLLESLGSKGLRDVSAEGKAQSDGFSSSLWKWWKGGEDAEPMNPANAVFDVDAPVIPLDGLDNLARQLHSINQGTGKGSGMSVEETRQVLANVNARRVVRKEHHGLRGLQEDAVAGFCARLERGNLGLTKCSS